VAEVKAAESYLIRTRQRQVAIAVGAAVLLVLLILPVVYKAAGLTAESLIYPASVGAGILFGIQLWSWGKLSETKFDPYMMFLCGALLFNGSRVLLEVFQLNYEGGMLGPQISSETTLTTIYLVALGLWCFHLGGVLGASPNRATPSQSGQRSSSTYENLRLVGWLLIAIAIVPSFVILKDAVTSVLSYGYFVALFQKEMATSLSATPQLLAAFLVPGAFLVTAAGKGRRVQLSVSAALVCLYCLIQLSLGSRSFAAAALIPYVWLWHRCIKPVPKLPVLIGAAILVFVISPLVGVARQFTGSNRYSPAELVQALYSIENPAVSIISEMGGTARTLSYTVDLVPEAKPYDLGRSYAYGALTLIPNLFWEIHPTIAHGTPNTWLAWTVDTYNASRGGGLGYSFIAEEYYNAGWLGVALGSALIGFAFSRLVAWVSNPEDLARVACTATILAFTLKYVRSDCSEVIRGIVWYAFGPYALVKMLSAKRSSRGVSARREFTYSRQLGVNGTWK
jgi:oligosaccharide repeat unit polymerase